MRRLILLLFIIANASLGIACACPSEAAPVEMTAHDEHHGNAAQPDDASDCCDDCDQHSASAAAEPLPVVFDLRLVEEDWDEFRNDLPVALDFSWEDGDPPDAGPLSRTYFLPDPNPVLLSDRMLE